MKNTLDMINGRTDTAKEKISQFEDTAIETCKMRKKKKLKKKWTKHEWAVETVQAFWYTWNLGLHGRGEAENNIWKNNDWTYSKSKKNISPKKQGAQLTPSTRNFTKAYHKLLKTSDKEKNHKSNQGEKNTT